MPTSRSSATQLVLLDTALADAAWLQAAIPADMAVVTISPFEDGLARMAEAVASHAPVQAIHVLSHGQPGGFRLGGSQVDLAALGARAEVFAAIGAGLAPDGDILVYSCEVAQGPGEAFLDALAAATGADIAASRTLTGAAALGGDWDLDWTRGHVGTPGLKLDGYAGVLEPGLELTADALDPLFEENGAGEPLFHNVSIFAYDLPLRGLTLTVENLADGAAERLGVTLFDLDIPLVDGLAGTFAGGATYAVTVIGTTATVTLGGALLSSAEAQALIESITYRNTSDAPGTDAHRVVTIAEIEDVYGNTAQPGIASSVELVAVNDAPTFAPPTGGLARVDAGMVDMPMNLAVQGDGKIVMVGITSGIAGSGAIAIRLNADGTPDAHFGADGKVMLNSAEFPNAALLSVAVLDNGDLVFGGASHAGMPSHSAFLAVRLQADGSFHPAFGQDGKATLGTLASGYDMAIDADGKMVVGGYVGTGSAGQFAVARFNADGSPDAAFGIHGVAILDTGTTSAGAYAVALDADGNILLAGQHDGSFAVLRLTPGGELDTTFGEAGIVSAMGSGFAQRILVQPDGSLVLVGTVGQQYAVMRLDPNGVAQADFGTNGMVTIAPTGAIGHAFDAEFDAAGRLLIVGQSVTGQYDIIRLNADGTLDETFGDGGRTFVPAIAAAGQGVSVAALADGGIVVAGSIPAAGGTDFGLVRLRPDGSLDTTFDPQPGADTLGGNAAYTKGQPAVVLDGSAAVYDAELAARGHYEGASVTLQRREGANAEDTFSGSGALKLVADSDEVELGGVVIGTYQQAGGSLTITFNADATQARVNEALSAIAYANTSSTPPAKVVIEWTFQDGNHAGGQGSGGPQQASGTTTVNITSINDAPQIVGFEATHVVALGSNWYHLGDPGEPIAVIDPDTPVITEGTLEISLSGPPSNDNFMLGGPNTPVAITTIHGNMFQPTVHEFRIDDVLVGTMTGPSSSASLGNTLTLSLTNATLEHIVVLLQSIRYVPGLNAPAGERTLTVKLNDGQDDSEIVSTTINVVEPPKVQITTESGADGFNAESFYVYFTWNVALPPNFSFGLDDIAVSGGTLSSFMQNPTVPTVYRALFTPNPGVQNSSLSISVAADLFLDEHQLGNAAATLTLNGDTLAPTLLSVVRAGAGEVTNSSTLAFIVTFSEALAAEPGIADFVLNGTAAAHHQIVGVSPLDSEPNRYVVTIQGPAEAGADGSLALALAADNAIADAAGNSLKSLKVAGANESFTIDTSAEAPTLAFAVTGEQWKVTINGLEAGAGWEYSLDGGLTWDKGDGPSFLIPLQTYAANAIQVRQTDLAGNQSEAGSNASPLVPPQPQPQPEPQPPMDGNGDGIPDDEQADVTSLVWSQSPDGQTRYVTLANDGGLAQTGVTAGTVDPAHLPGALALPLGTLAFTVSDVPDAGIVTFSVFIDGDIPVNGYFKQVDGHWVNIATAITEVGGKTRIDFSIEDGGPLDADGVRNGVIVDPGAPGWFDGNPHDTDDDQVPDLLEFELGLTPGVKDNDVFGRSDLFVLQLYRDALGREADGGGLAYWQERLDTGALGRTELVVDVLHSAEATAIAELARLTLGLFERAPDGDELAAWREGLAAGGDVAGLADAFVMAQYGHLADADFVDLLYQDALGRAADEAGRDYWLEQLAGSHSRGDVALQVLHSGEFEQAHLQAVEVASLYAGLLGRAADAQGLAYWSAELAAGGTLAGVAAAIVGSVEYHDRFLPEDGPLG